MICRHISVYDFSKDYKHSYLNFIRGCLGFAPALGYRTILQISMYVNMMLNVYRNHKAY